MIVKANITINGSIDAVWMAISNIQKTAEIISGVQKIEILNKPEAGLKGLKWQETRMYFGKPASIVKWITDAVENKYIETRAEMDGFIFLTTIAISLEGDNILLTSSHQTIATNFLAKIKSLPMVFFKGMLKKVIEEDLKDIKTSVELKQ